MDAIKSVVDFVLHIDTHLVDFVAHYGLIVYLLLFIIIFIETGIVVFPFLPGDSLIFTVGAIGAIGGMNMFLAFFILALAAILGDSVNYSIGNKFGRLLMSKGKLIKPQHVEKTEEFYSRHGAKAIVIGRFTPIIRTFIPFVAGIGSMQYRKFLSYNVIGGICWVLLFLLAGLFFGNVPVIKNNFEFVIIAIVVISTLPSIVIFIKEKINSKKEIETKSETKKK